MTEFMAIVKCPKCGYKQKTTTIRRVRCLNERCQKDYTILPIMGKGQPKINSRIEKVIKGSSWKEYFREKKRRRELK